MKSPLHFNIIGLATTELCPSFDSLAQLYQNPLSHFSSSTPCWEPGINEENVHTSHTSYGFQLLFQFKNPIWIMSHVIKTLNHTSPPDQPPFAFHPSANLCSTASSFVVTTCNSEQKTRSWPLRTTSKCTSTVWPLPVHQRIW